MVGAPVIPTWGEIAYRLTLAQPHPIEVAHEPLVLYLVEPRASSIGLVGVGSSLHLSGPRSLARGLTAQPHGPGGLVAVWVNDQDLLELGWTFLAAVGRRLLDGEELGAALELEVARWRDLVLPLRHTSRAAAIGVLGELAVMKAALEEGMDASVWAGRDGGPHDFRVGVIDLEVKTTLGDRHRHIINGASQLVPVVGHQLFVASLVLIEAGAVGGASVASLVADVVRLGVAEDPLCDFLVASRSVDIRDDEALSRYVLRSSVLTVEVSTTLPAITPSTLTAMVGAEAWRLSDMTYRLDLEGWPPASEASLDSILRRLVL